MKIEDIGKSIIEHPVLMILLIALLGIAIYFMWKAILAIVLLILYSIITVFALIGISKTKNVLSGIAKTILIFLIPVVMVMSVIGVYQMVGILYTPDTETNVDVYDPFGFGYFTLKGGFTDRTGNPNELLDNTKYVASWKSDGASEKIVVKASCSADTGKGWIEWRVYLSPSDYSGSNIWDPDENPDLIYSTPTHHDDRIYWDFHDGDNPGRIWYTNNNIPGDGSPTEVFHIIGSYSGYYLRVEFLWHVEGWTVVPPHPFSHTLKIHDEAVLLDGSGRVDVTYEHGTAAQEGEDVTFHVTTGASGPSVGDYEHGWVLTLYYPDNYPNGLGGKPLRNWSIDDNVHGYAIRWTVPSGIWKPNIHPFTVVLKNTLINQDEKEVVIVDNRNRMPPPPDIYVKKWANISETIPVSIVAYENPNTSLPIDHIHFAVWYGDMSEGNYIIYWRDVYDIQYIGNAWRYNFTFTPLKSGIVTIGARAYDTEGRIGEIGYASVNVGKYTPPGQIYIPGEWVKWHLDSQHSKSMFLSYPNKILYQFVAPNGVVVYEMGHKPERVEESNNAWRVVDDVSWEVPAFAKQGTWHIHAYIGSSTIPFVKSRWKNDFTFKVADAPLRIDMVAPLYLHKNMLLFTIDWKLPPPAAWIGIAVVIAAVIVVGFLQREKIARMLKRRT